MLPSIKLDIPGEDYILTTFEEIDVEALQEFLDLDSVHDHLILVPKPGIPVRDIKPPLLEGTAPVHNHLPERSSAFSTQGFPLPLQVIRHSGRVIGCVSLTPRATEPIVELGYYIHPLHQGKRIVPEAARKVLQYAANEFGIWTVYATADVGNVPSQRIIESLARESKGEVVTGTTVLTWPKAKKVLGREVNSPSKTWMWNIEPVEGYRI